MSQLKGLYTSHNRHWLMKCKWIWCYARSAKNKEKRTKFKCRKCKRSLCATSCFGVYHTKMHFWGSTDIKMEKQNTQISVNTTTETIELLFYDCTTVHRNRFLVNKTNRCTEFQFYWYYYSTCFGQPFCPSSGVLSCTSALVHFMQLWWTVCYQE